MKKIILIVLLLSMFAIAGCSKYEKDDSYDTNLYGSYLKCIEDMNNSYSLNNNYTFNEDSTYNHKCKEIINGTKNTDSDTNGKILSIEQISDDITQITLDEEITELSTDNISNKIIYKYKNMLGGLFKLEIPSGKTFDLIIPTPSDNWAGSYPNAANIFNKNGIYHSCLDTTNCNDTEENHMGVYYEYVRKNNVIYFIDPRIDDMDYQILYYITDNGLFFPELYKEN